MQHITQASSDRTKLITLNRAEKRNALTVEMVDALRTAVDRVAGDTGVAAVVINGAGLDFCAGMDLSRASDEKDGAGFLERFAGAFAELLNTIERIEKPVIAAVHGSALAGGAALVAVCDLAVADLSARLGYPGIRHGLVAPLVIPSLIRAVGERRARSLLITGDSIDGGVAQRIGLITHLAEHQTPIDLATKLAEQLTELPSDAIGQVKRSLVDMRAAGNGGGAEAGSDRVTHIYRFPPPSDSS